MKKTDLNWIYRVEIRTPVDEPSRQKLGKMINETVTAWVAAYGGDVDVAVIPGLTRHEN